MKKLLSYICWVLAIFCLMGCGSDGGAEMIPEQPAAERVSVKLQLGVSESREATRAGYSDSLNSSGEWMKNWFVYNPQNEMLPFHKTKCSETQNEMSSL